LPAWVAVRTTVPAALLELVMIGTAPGPAGVTVRLTVLLVAEPALLVATIS
jgi:hypothetical protein